MRNYFLSLLLLLCFLFTISTLLFSYTIVDSVFIAPSPYSGSIENHNYNYEYEVNYMALAVGDTGYGYVPPHAINAYYMSYLSFEILDLDIEKNYHMIELSLFIGEHPNSATSGNDIMGEWPIFGNADVDIFQLWVDHVDIGYELNVDDLTAGDEGDIKTIESRFNYITRLDYTPDTGFIIVDVTDQILNDLEDNRIMAQFRMQFDSATDNDGLYDSIIFRKLLTVPDLAPHLKCYYDVSEFEENTIADDFNRVIINNHPNPFNPITTIEYGFKESGLVKIEIFNTKGQLIETLVDEYKNAGDYSVEWNAENRSSGMYFYRIRVGEQSEVGRCLILK